jgi:hypothetical protein
MYGLPQDIDLSFFSGKELIQVAIGLFNVQLHFEGSVSVSVEHRIEHTSEESTLFWEQEVTPPVSTSSLLNLIGSNVTLASAVPDGTLTLQFSNGDTVRVFDQEDEAYTVHNGNQTFIV